MHIQKIRIENFKSIYEPIDIDFNDVKGFWKISGAVGAGKTSIGESIIYGLFGSISGKNQSDLISWGRKKGCIELWCTSKNRNIYIKRELNSYGQSPIYVEVDGEVLNFTNKRDAQAQLESEYYDISRTTIELLCVISFNNFKSLATLNSQDSKKFLDHMLGFSILNEYSKICKEFMLDNDRSLEKCNIHISNIESQINKLEELSKRSIIEGDKKSIINHINDINILYNEKIKENQSREKDISLKKIELTKQQSTILALGKNKKKEIDFIEKGKCPTCGSPIDQSQLQIKIEERNLLLEQYTNISNRLKNLQESSDKQFQEFNLIHIKPLEDKLKDLKSTLIRLEEQEKWININKSQIIDLKKDIDRFEAEKIDREIESNQWRQLYDILSSSVKFEVLKSFIPSLNKNILKYSQQLHLPYIVEFTEEFKCNIQLCGTNQLIPISSLSTGQLKTVDMVIILGFLGTIMGSNGINILFLDELFSNLDSNLRNDMCSILKQSISPDTTIFIISHTDLDDKYFDGSINISLESKDKYEKHSKITITKNLTI